MRALKEEFKMLFQGKFILLSLIFPLVVATIIGYIFANNQINKAPIAIIDQDNSLYSRQLIDKLNASQYVDVLQVYHQVLDPNTIFANGSFLAVIDLPQGLEANRYQGVQSNIGLLVDNTVPSATTALRNGVTEVIMNENMSSAMGKLKTLGFNDDQGKATLNSISLQQRLLYNPNGDYMYTNVLIFTSLVSVGVLTAGTMMIVPRLRMQGRLTEELEHPFGLLSRVIPYAIVSGIGSLFSLGMLKMVGNMRFVGNPLEFIVPLMLYTLVASYLAMFATWKAPNPMIASKKLLLLVMPNMLLSGVQTPMELMPKSVQFISDILPLTWLFRFVHGMGMRGGHLVYFQKELGGLLFYLGILSILIFIRIFVEKMKFSKQETTQQLVEVK